MSDLAAQIAAARDASDALKALQPKACRVLQLTVGASVEERDALVTAVKTLPREILREHFGLSDNMTYRHRGGWCQACRAAGVKW